MSIFEPDENWLDLYRERAGDPAFWAEPLNAITNASFVIAAICAAHLALRRHAKSPVTVLLIAMAAVIGVGSFIFHTTPNVTTMWMDVIPISLFQVLFMWLMSREVLRMSRLASVIIIVGVVGTSFVLMPIKEILNGSLFYIPPFAAMLGFGIAWAERSRKERFVLLIGAAFFFMAIAARSADKSFEWKHGTHFIWHSLNGVVVYCALRTWIVFVSSTSRAMDQLAENR